MTKSRLFLFYTITTTLLFTSASLIGQAAPLDPKTCHDALTNLSKESSQMIQQLKNRHPEMSPRWKPIIKRLMDSSPTNLQKIYWQSVEEDHAWLEYSGLPLEVHQAYQGQALAIGGEKSDNVDRIILSFLELNQFKFFAHITPFNTNNTFHIYYRKDSKSSRFDLFSFVTDIHDKPQPFRQVVHTKVSGLRILQEEFRAFVEIYKIFRHSGYSFDSTDPEALITPDQIKSNTILVTFDINAPISGELAERPIQPAHFERFQNYFFGGIANDLPHVQKRRVEDNDFNFTMSYFDSIFYLQPDKNSH